VTCAGQWFSPGIPVSSTTETDRYDITEILLKVVLNTITPTLTLFKFSLLVTVASSFDILYLIEFILHYSCFV
jgi:hypothetical protein